MFRNPHADLYDVSSPDMSPNDLTSMLHLKRTRADRAFLTVSATDGADAAAAASRAYAQIADALRENKLEIVQERIFGSLNVEAGVRTARREALASYDMDPDGPHTYVQGRPPWGDGLAGIIVHAVSAAGSKNGVRIIRDHGAPCGRAWCSDDTEYVILQNIQGLLAASGDNAPWSQAQRAIERANRILHEHGASYRNAARTWFYLSDILGWYREFNRARSAKYAEFGLMPRPGEPQLLPASTGIRADAPTGAACTVDLLAVLTPDARGPAVTHLANPGQQEAFRYGSAFSRSAVIHGSQETLVEISGTAAIDENGQSLHPGDVRAQTRCTLDKVAVLLDQAKASLKDICAATVFVKHAEDAQSAREVMAGLGLDGLPAVWVVADVCRDELLFEIDAEAVIPRRG